MLYHFRFSIQNLTTIVENRRGQFPPPSRLPRDLKVIRKEKTVANDKRQWIRETRRHSHVFNSIQTDFGEECEMTIRSETPSSKPVKGVKSPTWRSTQPPTLSSFSKRYLNGESLTSFVVVLYHDVMNAIVVVTSHHLRICRLHFALAWQRIYMRCYVKRSTYGFWFCFLTASDSNKAGEWNVWQQLFKDGLYHQRTTDPSDGKASPPTLCQDGSSDPTSGWMTSQKDSATYEQPTRRPANQYLNPLIPRVVILVSVVIGLPE